MSKQFDLILSNAMIFLFVGFACFKFLIFKHIYTFHSFLLLKKKTLNLSSCKIFLLQCKMHFKSYLQWAQICILNLLEFKFYLP